MNAAGGAQWRAITLFEMLSEVTDVQLWTEPAPDPWFIGRYPIKQIGPNQFPKEGNLVFVGAYFRISNWVEYSKPRRIIVIFNSHLPDDLRNCLAGFAKIGRTDVEVAFASEGTKKMVGDIEGPIHVSPINRERFQPRPTRNDTFTVGRMGRDDWSKSHPEDPAFFKSLLDHGYRVRIMGCAAAKWGLPNHPNLELLSRNQESAEEFLNSLHAYHFRGHPDWYETFGRVNLESMCCGVPVVAEARHGYTDYLKHGRGGCLYETTEQSFSQLESLRASRDLWQEQSQLALEEADRALSQDRLQELVEFYTR